MERRRHCHARSRQLGSLHVEAGDESDERAGLASQRAPAAARECGAWQAAGRLRLRLLPPAERNGSPGKRQRGRSASSLHHRADRSLQGRHPKVFAANMDPPAHMVAVAKAATDDEVRIAAAYFSSLKLKPWIRVVESDTVPKTTVSGNM